MLCDLDPADEAFRALGGRHRVCRIDRWSADAAGDGCGRVLDDLNRADLLPRSCTGRGTPGCFFFAAVFFQADADAIRVGIDSIPASERKRTVRVREGSSIIGSAWVRSPGRCRVVCCLDKPPVYALDDGAKLSSLNLGLVASGVR